MLMESRTTKIGNTNLLELADMIKAISHPSRMAIMYLICKQKDKKMSVKDIYIELKMAQPVISRHLGILKNSKLVERVAEGQFTFYKLNQNNDTVNRIAKCFLSL
jgi:DNA-binding transcriptional ArsR family regulator